MPPHESYDVTHGICEACLGRGVAQDLRGLTEARRVGEFFSRLRAEARKGYSTTSTATLEEADALGVRPLELLVGFLQPGLDEIGRAWERGEVTVATEHRFSEMVEALATTVLHRAREQEKPNAHPEFLLVNADGNFHTVGLRVVEAFLLSRGRSVQALIPGLPTREVLALVRSLRPRTLGLSLSLPGQLDQVRELATALANLPAELKPQLVVGGSAIRAGLQVDPALGARVCLEVRELLTPA